MGLNAVNMRSCRIYRATSQTGLTSGAATAVIFSTSQWNPHPMAEFTTNPTRITIDKTGLYLVSGGLTWAAGATGLRTLQVQQGGVANDFRLATSMPAPASGTGLQTISGHVYLVAGNYIELIATHTQGAGLDITADTTGLTPFFACSLVHPLYDPSAAAEAQ